MMSRRRILGVGLPLLAALALLWFVGQGRAEDPNTAPLDVAVPTEDTLPDTRNALRANPRDFGPVQPLSAFPEELRNDPTFRAHWARLAELRGVVGGVNEMQGGPAVIGSEAADATRSDSASPVEWAGGATTVGTEQLGAAPAIDPEKVERLRQLDESGGPTLMVGIGGIAVALALFVWGAIGSRSGRTKSSAA